MWLVNVVLAIIETLTVHLMDKGAVNSATYQYSQSTGIGTPQFYGFAEIDMDYSQEPSEAKRNYKKRKGISLFCKDASSAESVLRG